uniref:Transcription initiation factor TFIID subunit 13 n=1 Tax=Fibrocapsa japonica TaxID=94617 RepID=A0A7S2V4H1_9STRA|mmetsp:Transcript_3894/g.5793  ORF Transcript_3894/g.5793 Transcript_3894/m.5793 type:complete len:148 (+) Transcript_3894:128-571(+)|eukprot:CAMPEP_0113935666 /NCGR_PEP_ID=MMETSP1339-20121228/2781_1 /TAXON_ID=94617 /ORGANISM="Fibrocapsa japonica" /LENGTH=147 /DNA_ID=CAMNT_0000937899 /DNA_START=118 /DNA_END=561 /DNA_ORIENTATION=+ /assembly_acc=CAM_ASM_000762
MNSRFPPMKSERAQEYVKRAQEPGRRAQESGIMGSSIHSQGNEETTLRGMLIEDLKPMMYGFGDSSDPHPDTLELMESFVLQHVAQLVSEAEEIAQSRGGRMDTDCFVQQAALRDDPRKFQRIKDLLQVNDELRNVRKNELDEKSLS